MYPDYSSFSKFCSFKIKSTRLGGGNGKTQSSLKMGVREALAVCCWAVFSPIFLKLEIDWLSVEALLKLKIAWREGSYLWEKLNN